MTHQHLHKDMKVNEAECFEKQTYHVAVVNVK